MSGKTIRLTMAQAVVRYLAAQRSEIDGKDAPLIAGTFAIFGHGNVAGMGEALAAAEDVLPTYRAHNEQSMALAAIAYAKAKNRRQFMACTTSIGPGATNMVTAAALAHVDRLPVLLLPGDIFASRLPDPVLQQIEHFGDPSLSVNDTFKPVSRFWDRIMRPEQLLQSLPQAIRVLTDPADCGPVTICLPQDIQAEAYDYPAEFFEARKHRLRRPAPDAREVADAAEALRNAKRPMVIIGGGVHYSEAVGRSPRLPQQARPDGGREPGRQGRAQLGRSAQSGFGRRHRFECREHAGHGCRRGAGDRHAAAGFHHRFLGPVQGEAEAHSAERRGL